MLPKRKKSEHNNQISLTSNEDGTYNVEISLKKCKVGKKKQGKVFVLVDIEEDLPIEVRVGDMAFKPKLVLKLQRRIKPRDRFLAQREYLGLVCKPHIL